MTTLFIAGATGLVGGLSLSLALMDERVKQIIAPSRRPLDKHDKLLNPDMAEWNRSSQDQAWKIDGAVCALGTTRAKAGSAAAFRAVDFDLVLSIASRLRAMDVERFALTSSLGANRRSPLLYPRTKGEVEAAVERLEFPSLTIVRPGFLAGERTESRAAEQMVGAILGRLSPFLPAAARVSPAASVAHLLLEAAISGMPGKHTITSADVARY
jgi:uncharacterized protein YbjT (DUF2867 family)